jgi:4'-phosphopantetheinyl transferase
MILSPRHSEAATPLPRFPTHRLRSGEICLWTASLLTDADGISACEALLSDDEMSRADRFHFERDRRRFVVARATLRRVLAACTGIPAAVLPITTGEFGKPALDPGCGPIHFNLAHSEDRALIAVSRDSRIGVDLEAIDHESRLPELARSIAAPAELAQLAGLADEAARSRALLRLWTAKEAFLKAIGTGLQIAPGRLEVSASVREGSYELGTVRWIDSPGVSSLYALHPLPGCEARYGCSAAVAVLRGGSTAHRIVWHEDDDFEPLAISA